MRIEKKQYLRKLRRWRTRKIVVGTSERPRMSVRFTGQHIYVQFIDDRAGRTLAAVSTRGKQAVENVPKTGANMSNAKIVGGLAASTAKTAGIQSVVFDRSGARFHGKVKALADAAREGGLKF